MASLQITEEEQVCRKEGGMQSRVEDETEYEIIKWRSTVLILFFDFRLGCSLIYITVLRQREGTVKFFTHSMYINTYPAIQDTEFICHIHFLFCLRNMIHLIANHSSSLCAYFK